MQGGGASVGKMAGFCSQYQALLINWELLRFDCLWDLQMAIFSEPAADVGLELRRCRQAGGARGIVRKEMMVGPWSG